MTTQNSYVYELDLDWTRRWVGNITAEDLPPLEVSAPPEFSGEPGV